MIDVLTWWMLIEGTHHEGRDNEQPRVLIQVIVLAGESWVDHEDV